jgi:hypothetical protein
LEEQGAGNGRQLVKVVAVEEEEEEVKAAAAEAHLKVAEVERG